MGKQCFHAVSDIPGEIDMAIIVTPAPTVPGLAEECGKKKVKTLIVISAGFGETGTQEGHATEQELKKTCETYAMSMVGPNCLGILRPSIGLNASFAATPKESGDVALLSQSGAMAVALLDAASEQHLHFSFIASIGNKTDLDEVSFLEICENDTETKVIGLYLESIKDGPAFIETAKRIGRTKPIVLIKAGVSLRGAKAVSSHTGALAGSTAGLMSACEAAGIYRAESTQEFLALLTLLRSSPPLVSRDIAIITNAGGPGVLATDAAEREGLRITEFSTKTVASLKAALPTAASAANPVDVLGDALADRYSAALTLVANDPNTEGIVVLLTPQVMTPSTDIAQAIVEIKKTRPLLPITTSFMGGTQVLEARSILRKNGIACFALPEEAVRGLAILRQKNNEEPQAADNPVGDDTASAARQLLKGRSGLLSEEIVAELFALYGLEIPQQAVATSAKEAQELAEKIGFPVIVKISSPDILHKTDVGGVRANLMSCEETAKAYDEIIKSCAKHAPHARVRGVLVQQFLPIGSEFIVGGLNDASFGPIVMAGLGGIYTELFNDTCFKIAPVGPETSYGMLSSLRSWKLLTGMRGKGTLAIDSLASVIQKISQMLSDCPHIAEIDLNPVLVGKESIVIADTKVVMG